MKKTASKQKVQTRWDLPRLFYRSLNDPKLSRDMAALKNAYRIFEQKYKGKDLTRDTFLLNALRDWGELVGLVGGNKPLRYLGYLTDLDASDKKASAMSNKVSLELQAEANRILFFELELGKIPKSRQKALLADKRFAPYRYFLSCAFLRAEHNLTEKEEQLMGLLSLPAAVMWQEGVEHVVSSLTVLHKKKRIAVTGATEMLSDMPVKERRTLHKKCMETLWTAGDFAEKEINAIYTAKKISDELRGYPLPYSETALSHQTGQKEIEAVVEAVSRGFAVSRRFFDLKRKLLREEYLTYADRGAKIGTLSQKMSFSESVDIVRGAFGDLGSRYEKMFDAFLKEGRIDVYPKAGKRGGAYCSGGIGIPTVVLLNHVDTVRSLMTLAHEMGHAVHTELSKSQPPLYQGYSTAVAEVASTLFENIVFEKVWERLSPKEQIIALHDRLNDAVSTIFRQIACFQYELAMHLAIREKGALSKEEMATMHNTYMGRYLGDSVRLEKDDGAFFIKWPHLRYSFYVYSYAYGELISRALFARFKQDRSYFKEIERFLSAGGSKAPKDIFGEIGIDITDPSFFAEGIRDVEEDLKRLERLTKKR
jgi:oligoendopeptidase F